MTASIAHEINQPLGAILASADAAEMLLESGTDRREDLRRIVTRIRRDDLRASDVIGRFGGEELPQAKIIGGQIVFQFGDAIFHVRPAVVVSPELFRRQPQVDECGFDAGHHLSYFADRKSVV